MQGTEFLIVLGSGALLLGLATIIWISLTKRRGYGTPNWPSIEGQIVSACVSELTRETPEGMVSSFTPVVRYEYALDGEVYQSDRLNILSDEHHTFDDRRLAEDVVAKYRPGAGIDVFYNLANPKQAVLSLPRPSAHNAVLAFGVTNLIAGASVLALGILLL